MYSTLEFSTIQEILNGQTEIVQMITAGTPLAIVLDKISQWLQAQSTDGLVVSILLVNETGDALYPIAGPDIPQGYLRAINRIPIAPNSGSCGTAAFTREVVVVENLKDSSLWTGYKDVAMEHGLQACWSMPLINREGKLRGTFAGYYREPKMPTEKDQQLISLVSHTALLAIEYSIAEEEKIKSYARESQVHATLLDSEQRVRSFVESAPFPIGVYVGREMRIQFVNEAIIQAWGKGRDLVGKTYAEVLPELDNQNIYQQLDDVFTTGIPYHAKYQRVDLNVNGKLQPFYFNYSFTPLYDASGKIYGVMNTAADVTDLKMMHNQLEKSEQNLRNIILQAPVAMSILTGPDHMVEIANQRMFELWGKSEAEMLNKPLFEGLPEVKSQGFEELLHSVYTTGETYTANGQPVRLPRSGGVQTVFVNFVYEAFRNGDGTISGVMVVAVDVTEQVLATKKIEEAEERARLAIEASDQGTYEVNLLTNELVASARMAEMFDVEDITERKEFVKALHGADKIVREKAYKIAYQTGQLQYEGRVIWRDGSTHWMKIMGKIFFDKENTPVRLLGVVQDITEQKEFAETLRSKVEERTSELAKANQHLAAINKELEQFTYAASHDMQEPLRKVQTFSSILINHNAHQLDERGQNYVKKIGLAVERMKTIINDLLNYSYQLKEERDFEPVDLNRIADDIEADLELTIQQKKASINRQQLPKINGVHLQMNQLFYNLYNNALKFARRDNPPVINIVSAVATDEEVISRGMLPANKYVRVSFSDNGIGFEQKYSEHIFTLFKRLHSKDEYDGTGIGLGLCRKIVENHKGAIWAEAEPGLGATFHIMLPCERADC